MLNSRSSREAQALYAQNHRQYLSDNAAQELINQTGGWITGIVLADLPGNARVSGVDTFAYLAHQVLNQQPEHIRQFLMRTSMPEEFNAEFCEVVLGPFHSVHENWYSLMSLILEKNLIYTASRLRRTLASLPSSLSRVFANASERGTPP